MKNKIFWIIPALTLLFVSCNKELNNKEEIRSEKISGLEVKANLSSLTKSRLGQDGLTLNWEANDRIALWSTYIGTMRDIESAGMDCYRRYSSYIDPGTAVIVGMLDVIHANSNMQITGALSLNSGAGTSSATFVSDKNPEDWFYQPQEWSYYGNSTDNKYYWFNAMYPAPSIIPGWQFYEQVIPQYDNLTVYQPYIMVNVPSVQDGKSYWDYQILIERGLDDRPAPAIETAKGIVTKDEILGGDHTIDFDDWTVMTSLLEFTVRSSDEATRSIDHIDITFETPDNHYNDCFALSGTVPVFLLLDEEYEAPMRSSFSSSLGFHSPVRKSDPSHWSLMDGGVCKVTLQFDQKLTVTHTASETLYAVVIPTMYANNLTTFNDKPRMVFSAYDSNGDLVLSKKLEMSNTNMFYLEKDDTWYTCYPGIWKGTKYSFNLEMDPIVRPEDALSGQFSLSADTKAYIARGNLQAYITNSVRDQSQGYSGWKIADHQYDFVGMTSADYTAFVNGTYTGLFDLCAVSTNDGGNDHGITVSTNLTGSAMGWTDCMSVAGWRTITADEGVYLFAERPNAADLFSYATIYAGTPEQAIYVDRYKPAEALLYARIKILSS